MAGRLLLLPALTIALVLTSCSAGDKSDADSVAAPELGACRLLEPDDVAASANSAPTVDCADDHTAETYAVGPLPSELDDAAYDDADIGTFAFQTCSQAFMKFLGADESMAMRTILSWAWFRPSEEAWKQGAHWWRCDVVGGGQQSKAFVNLPETAKGVLLGKPDDRWLVCVNGPTVSGSVKIPCSEKHTWRAVTSIVLGKPDDEYPGDRVVEVRTRDFCSDSVGAWLNYPVDYEYGFTWFHEAEWKAGNRRSICWAKTDQ